MTTHARPSGRRAKTVALTALVVAVAATAVSCTASDASGESDTTGREDTAEPTGATDDLPAPDDPGTREDPADSEAPEAPDVPDAPDASEAAGPGFLEASDLPPDSAGPWTALEVAAGLPEQVSFCVEETLPDGGSRHRAFRTELDAGAVQITVVQPDEAAAAELAALLDASIERCATDYEARYPGTIAEYRDYGTLDVGDGARVHGVHIAQDYGAMDIDLFAVGRDGDTVTLVQWGRLGDFTTAPVADFQSTATTAVDRLR